MTSASKFDPALQAQITALGDRMDSGLKEIKDMLMSLDTRLRSVELAQAGDVPLLRIRMDAAWKKIDGHDKAISDLTKNADNALEIAQGLERVAKWMLGIFTAILIAILILFLTGKATVVFN